MKYACMYVHVYVGGMPGMLLGVYVCCTCVCRHGRHMVCVFARTYMVLVPLCGVVASE